MKRHPTDGTLRRLVDEPAGVADADREHVANCPTCLAALDAVRQDADVVAAGLIATVTASASATVTAVPDVDAGWRRLSGALAVEQSRRAVVPAASAHRWHARLRSPVVAVAGVVMLLTGAGIAAAADWLPIFRTEQIAPVTITEADVVALPDLSAYGHVEFVSEPDVHQVADAQTAEAISGLPVPQVGELPSGVSGEPVLQVGGQAVAVFTFSAAMAAQAVAPATLPPPPPGMDGAAFRLVAGPGQAQVWSADSGLPALVVARAVAPTAYSSGVPFATARDYLLSLPGLPDDVVSQLRGFTGGHDPFGTTLPLPLPAGLVTSAEADVDGAAAQVLTSSDGTLTAVVWVQDGIVTAVGGSLSADEVLSIARGLQ